MMLQLKLIWYLLNLIAIVRGSAGFSIFHSKELSSAYIPSAAPFLNGSTVQPPLTSHHFESSPPGPENIQPPSTVTISPTLSPPATKPPPGPEASIKVSPSRQPPSTAPPPSSVPLHDLAPQQPPHVFVPPPVATPDIPVLQSPASILKHANSPPSSAPPPLAPQKPTHVYTPPPIAFPDIPAVLSPVVAPHASVSPQASIPKHAYSPASTAIPSHVSSLPPIAISPQTSIPRAPVIPSHVFASPPLVARPSLSTPPPSTTYNDSVRSPPAISPSISYLSPPFIPVHYKYASPPSIVAMPSHTVGRTPSALSPQASTTPKATLPPTPVTFHSSTPQPPVGSGNLAPNSPPIVPHGFALPLPVVLPSHFPTPSPSVAPHNLAPPVIPKSSAPPPAAVRSHEFSSSPTAPPTSKSRVSSHFSAPPPQSTPANVTAPPPQSTPANVTAPPHVLAPPPIYTPNVSAQSPLAPPAHVSNSPPHRDPPTVLSPPPASHDLGPPKPHLPSHFSPLAAPTHALNTPPEMGPPTALSPPPASHDLGAPPTDTPYISAAPPNATISEHSSAPPPIPPVHASSPPPHVLPPVISPPSPPGVAPSNDLAPSPPSSISSSPPPQSSAPPPSPPIHTSKNSSHPPSASVPSHASAPSTVAEPPLIASSPSVHKVPSRSLPPVSSPVTSKSSAPLVAPPVRPPSIYPVVPKEPEPPSIAPEAQMPHVSSPAPTIDQRGALVPIAPSVQTYPPANHHPAQGFAPYIAPSAHESTGLPSVAPTAEAADSPSFSPLPSTSDSSHSAPEISYTVPSPAPKQQGQVESPAPENTPRYHPPTSHNQGISPAIAPSQPPSTEDYVSPVPMTALPVSSGPSMTPFLSPEISPSGSSTSKPKLAPPILALPPPPPNDNCLSYTCLDPYTNTIPGSPCGCVLPMKVELRIGVTLSTFFPLVPELAREIATGIFMKQSQVRIMGANAATEQPDKTLLLIDLVPLGDKLDNITAFLIYERFWNKQVAISKSLFGDYEVLYVQYPGLPPSPPMAPSDIADINGGPYPGGQGSKIHPLGVDVTKQGRKHRLSGSLIAIIVFSAAGAVLLCLLLGWILLFRHRRHVNQSPDAPHVYPSSIARSTGPTGQSVGSRPSFSLSFESSVAAYTGSAKTFSAAEIEKATDNLNSSRVLGEGGFGRVYSGVLEDGTEVAVKVLKREDQQGGREFLAEVEMLSRLHHRNLVKLIGICVEEHIRCLVYELVPNGSVDSHLHGIDRQTAPLDWAVRLKIALGAARGLAYLHEDSSPRVIHRDFKASNILLEADFTPKVSDFGLARTAMDEENKHISTRVMGTFGYVAPEYAMTGHLLVKSDVYSYGVVLLELLTGRKPVDMSQPPGQENLVAWTRPYLTSKEALKSIIDPDLGSDISFDSVAKVGAIASMCVQPEVSHRPFMGEVVQALKLVCNECDDAKDEFDVSSQDENLSNEARDHPLQSKYSVRSYGSGNGEDVEKGLSVSDIFSATDVGPGCKDSGSFRRYSSSGPIGGGRSWRFWKRARTTSSREEVVGENGMYRFWSGSH